MFANFHGVEAYRRRRSSLLETSLSLLAKTLPLLALMLGRRRSPAGRPPAASLGRRPSSYPPSGTDNAQRRRHKNNTNQTRDVHERSSNVAPPRTSERKKHPLKRYTGASTWNVRRQLWMLGTKNLALCRRSYHRHGDGQGIGEHGRDNTRMHRPTLKSHLTQCVALE